MSARGRSARESKQEPRIIGLLPREQHEALQAARREQGTEEFRSRYAARAGIEGTHEQAIRRCGLRRCRYIGEAKAHLQHLLTAAAINLVRLSEWWAGTPCRGPAARDSPRSTPHSRSPRSAAEFATSVNIRATSRKVAPGMLSQSNPLGSAPPKSAALLGPPPYQIACRLAGTSTCRPARSLQAGMREPPATAPKPAVIASDAAGRAYSTRRRRPMTGYFAAGVRNVGSTPLCPPLVSTKVTSVSVSRWIL